MQRVCFQLNVRPDRIDEYVERHANVWPEMRQALHDSGWNNYSLFLQGDGTLIGYLETDDFEAAQKKMAVTEVNERWQREMGDFFVELEGDAPDTSIAPMREIFHVD